MSEKKTADDIIGSAVYETTNPSIIPVNQRILCIEVDPGEVKTESGLILPGQKTLPDKSGTVHDKPRFVVAAAAGDAILIDADGDEYLLRQGDEVYPFWPPGAIDFDFPTVFDYKTKQHYITFHPTELAGFIKRIPKKK